jgi:hypothetical protein
VRVSFTGGRTGALPVGPDGSVELPRAVQSKSFRIDVLAAGGSARPAVAVAEVRGGPRVVVPRAGLVDGGCGDLEGTAGARRFDLRATGSVADLDAGRPLRMVHCGGPLRLPVGATELHVPPGVMRPLTLRLRSPAPAPVAPAAVPPGRVTDPGEMGRGSYDDVRLQVNEPSWLVLGESYNRGWKAQCDGRDLGAPKVVDGFANGWRVEPGCKRASFSFGPQRAVDWGYAIGALACLVLLALMLVRRPRRDAGAGEATRESAATPGDPLPVDDSQWRLPAGRALAAGVAAAVAFGFVFALRAGVVIGPVTALVLWRGISAKQMITIAGALLAIVVPAVYLIFPATDRGGYGPAYPVERLGAHWVTVGAVVLLILALGRQLLSTASRASRARAAAEPRPAPAARSQP